jgi:hypothetical protein
VKFSRYELKPNFTVGEGSLTFAVKQPEQCHSHETDRGKITDYKLAETSKYYFIMEFVIT